MKIAALRWPLACAALMFCAAASWGAPLTIEECLASAMKNNPDLLAAEEKITAQRATIGQAASAGRPQLSAGSSYSRGGDGLAGDNNSGSYSGNVRVEQSISDW